MTKINTQIEKQYYNALKYDIRDFELIKTENSKGLGAIGNLLLDYYHNKTMKLPSKLCGEKSKFQFNLDKDNLERWSYILTNYGKKGFESQGLIYRGILSEYCNLSKGKRERILFHKNVEEIEKAIEQSKKIVVKYKGEYRHLNPIKVMTSFDNRGTYLYCYCDKHRAYRNYRLYRINVTMIKEEEDIKFEELELKAEYDRNWSPFLEKKHKITIELDDEGMVDYGYKTTGKPQGIVEKGNILEFESSIAEATIYFKGFLHSMVRVEPKELRDIFEGMNKKILKRNGKLI